MGIRICKIGEGEDKFYAPADDIRHCFQPIVRGMFKAALESHARDHEHLCACAAALGRFTAAAIAADKPVLELLGDLRAALAEVPQRVAQACLTELAFGVIAYYAVASRETSAHPDLGGDQVSRVVEESVMLSGLRAADRSKVLKILKTNSKHAEELDRPPRKGYSIGTPGETDSGPAGPAGEPA